jgi:uncharacterized membrane protein
MTQSTTHSVFFIAVFVLVFLSESDAFQQSSIFISSRQRQDSYRGNVSIRSQSDAKKEFFDLGISEKRIVEIQSSLVLPFSAEIAYDAYSDSPRHPSWSAWLHAVEWADSSTTDSKWTMKFLGIKYSWTATSLKNERPHTIQWKSTSGLPNFGTVIFEELNQEKTTMTLTMTLAAPRAAAALFNKSKRLTEFIERKMIATSLDSFRDVVLETDVKPSL